MALGLWQGPSDSTSCPYPLQAQQRDLTIRRVKETEKELNRQLRQQKEHYEATIQRHLSFIDQVTPLWGACGVRGVDLQTQGWRRCPSVGVQC